METIETPSSSNVAEIGYEDNTREFRVKFRSGGTYDYAGVPREVFAAAQQAPSIGKFVAASIKNVFPAKKVG